MVCDVYVGGSSVWFICVLWGRTSLVPRLLPCKKTGRSLGRRLGKNYVVLLLGLQIFDCACSSIICKTVLVIALAVVSYVRLFL